MIASIQANIDESKISGTSVVGIFPHGAAACGAEELAGNVWEWCSTPYLEYPFKDEVIAESLYTKNKRAGRTCVLRGGSWFVDRVHAGCTWRLRSQPCRLVLDGLRVSSRPFVLLLLIADSR
jgi:formylglycine-generating enzyme required for sulfatase activity